MDFINIFIDVVKNRYADFNGRARRKEFWNYVLACVIIGVIFGVLGSILKPFSYVGLLVNLALLVPGIAVAVRRLHDLGKSGYFYFIVLIPLVGPLYLIYLFTQEGVKGANEYGPDPKEKEIGQ